MQFLRRPGFLLWFTIALNILLHAPFLHLPPCSIHVWRQCNTLAVARNFYEEDPNILRPRVDRRGESTGVTGMQFPAYEWGLSLLYSLAGESYLLQRIYSLVLSTLALLAAAGFFRLLTGNAFFGAAGAWIICWSPEFFYQGINALPDVLAFAAGFGALYFTLRWVQQKSTRHQLSAVLLITLAGLVKIQYGIFGLFMAALLFRKGSNRPVLDSRERKRWLLFGGLSIAAVLSWYRYAHGLSLRSGLHDFVLQLRPVADAAEAWSIVRRNLLSDFPELIFNYANTLFFVIGLVVLIRRFNYREGFRSPLLIAGIFSLAWYFLMLEQMRVHQYYLLPFLLLSTAIALSGFRYLLEGRFYLLAWILLLVQPALAAGRILPARWLKADKGIAAEFADAGSLEALRRAVPDDELVITGPDKSGCIWLYFLHKKGYSFESTADFLAPGEGLNNLVSYRKRGAKWVYTLQSEMDEDRAREAGLERVFSRGDFRVYRIR